MSSTIKLSERPAKVTLAVKLLYLVVTLGIVRTVITIMRHLEVRSPDFLIYAKVTIYALSVFLIFQIGRGKNWARWALIAIFIIHLPLTIIPTINSFSINPIHASLGMVQLVLYIAALLLLFHGSASGWYTRQSTTGD
ncbi:MAG: hypothetical protein GY703_09745 [Gammaproteobacteria bacterium]|nr:hypothetical protein [Gammaproteobacteria bacterium]